MEEDSKLQREVSFSLVVAVLCVLSLLLPGSVGFGFGRD